MNAREPSSAYVGLGIFQTLVATSDRVLKDQRVIKMGPNISRFAWNTDTGLIEGYDADQFFV